MERSARFGSVRFAVVTLTGVGASCGGEVDVRGGYFHHDPVAPRAAEAPVVDDDRSAINCGAAGPPRLSFAWDDLPTDADSASLPTTTLNVTVSNDGQTTLALSRLRAIGDASGVPFELAVGPAEFALPAGSTQSLTFDLGALDLAGMRSAGAVEVFALAQSEGGELMEQGASRALYFHPRVGGGLEVYGVDTMGSYQQAGDVFGEVDPDLVSAGTERVVVLATPAWAVALEGPQP